MSIADYKESLGLHSDPFQLSEGRPWQGLRELAVNLIHELEFSCPLVWVTGPRGAGKTTLAQHLQQLLACRGEVLLFDAAQGHGPQYIAQQLNELLLLTAPENSRELLAPAVQVFNSEQVDPIVLLVDNVDRLPERELNGWLTSLHQAGLLASTKIKLVVLACPPPGALVLNSAVPVHQLTLPTPNLVEATAWLNDLLLEAGASFSVLDEKSVTSWWCEAEGNFNRLVERARLHLLANGRASSPLRSVSAGTIPDLPKLDNPSAQMPPLDCLVSEEMTQADKEALASAGDGVSESLDVPQLSTKGQPSGRSLPVGHILTVAALLSGLTVLYLYTPEERVASQRVVTVQSESGKAPAVSSAATTRNTSVWTQPSQLESTDSKPGLVQERQFESLSASSVSIDVENAATLKQRSSQGSFASSTKTDTTELPAATQVDNQQEAYSSVRPPARKYSDDELEILSWSSNSYTLQVLGASQKNSALSYVARQSNSQVLRLFQTERSGKPWYVVLAGVYPDRAAAEAAKQNLPVTQQRAQPWLRQLSSVQQDILD
ncbi:AAA family ATPase [Gilvimarinus agarilyticus]|uniref:AAA family ATPase n=1 Tax=Gilvimarinus sp. 2_MG-2023 TaxID=3062666 RepID=UPI001C07FFF9|nr:AAA family ATPase [Gilvimarinus sp. 2_MG-2023]MBU2886625.1 AAA family ATPase [Gilvimarinus agarilyticus]MDO6571293.1 AAA family ATPase [Gilvimarinus sp. 2_MG-2023]